MMLLRFGIRSRLEISRRKSGQVISLLRFDNRDFYAFAKEIGVTASDKRKAMERMMKHCEETYDKEIIPVRRSEIIHLLKQCGITVSSVMRSRPAEYNYLSGANLEKVLIALDKITVPRECVKNVNFLKSLLSGHVRWERIRKISLKENSEPLYDISVPLFENYVANGFVVHNSTYRVYLRRGKKGTRVAKLVDAPAMPDGEIVFKVTEKGIEDAAVA